MARMRQHKNGNRITEQQALQERQKFVSAFNDTMLRIWQEQIALLGVIDTGALQASPKALPLCADGRFFEVGLSQSNTACGRTMARVARRPVETQAILAEPSVACFFLIFVPQRMTLWRKSPWHQS